MYNYDLLDKTYALRTDMIYADINDEDLEYLDINYFTIRAKETEDVSQKNKVIEMIRPAFVINYILDEEDEYMIIPGDCSYYK